MPQKIIESRFSFRGRLRHWRPPHAARAPALSCYGLAEWPQSRRASPAAGDLVVYKSRRGWSGGLNDRAASPSIPSTPRPCADQNSQCPR